ncbi:MAG: DNA polymerase III subunit alpha [Gemmataceae bacterium]|nr:DNA polymerase III subunit alpha [Gemmataceae bacterium]
MPERSFVHLHCHSHYSLLDGANRIPELVARTKEQGMNALALTDHGNLFGAIEFYSECKKAGINPIIGYEAYVAPGKRTEREARRRGDAGYHLTLLARNEAGFRNLVKMASIAYLEGYHYVPRIDKEVLQGHSDGLVCLSGCASSEFSEAILKDQREEATKLAEWFAKVFGKHFYIEIQNNGLDIQKHCAAGAIDIANRLGLPLVATCDAHYLCQADADAHDVLLCINTGKTRSDQNRMRYGSNQFYVRPPTEMYELFGDHADAVQRSQEIADGCDIQLDFKKRHFPVFTPPDKKKPEDYLRELCKEGLRERFGAKPPQAALDRLEHELGIICRMGFASYFLIVWDFVRFARENGIPSNARGSACGAVVSYVLRLSDVDPLEYDLLFERFLDPNRSEAPDIDIDFCQERREDVIAYVRQKYGEASVAQIVTFGTMAARAAIKDVGRVLDIPLERVNRLTNLVPKVLNISLDDALEQSPDLKKEYDTDPQIHELIDIARKLEGTNRNAGTHAAGVVIANGPLTDYVPLQRVVRKGDDAGSKAGEAVMTTQWVMGDLEKVGLLKMDFLGLRTLTLLDNAVRLIEKTRGEKIDLLKLPMDDKKTYALLQRGDTKGVFQFESDGIRELLKRMKPDNIRDLIACNALYRPGPLGGGMVDAYVNRKHGREKPQYPHAIMEEILRETYGVMVYQEQIMRILNRLGGIELSSAYACIKAISKKKQEIIDQRKQEFLKGAQERGVPETTAREIFDLITFFGGYGFNKSHSAAYAQIGFQTAYLKAHYTAEFMAALLSSEIDDSNKRDIMVQHIDDSRRLGAEVLPPSIQTGHVAFTVGDGKVLFGLNAIKGVGRGCCEEIVRAREEHGPFKDLFDFCERVDLKLVPRAAIEKLIKAGAFDCFGAHRAQLWAVLSPALQAAQEAQQDRKRGQLNLFDAAETDAAGPPAAVLPDLPEWPNNEKLKFEKEALDFYFSSHPLAQHDNDLRNFSTHNTSQLGELGPNQEVVLGGMLTQVRFQNVKKARNGNTRYVRCKVEDLNGNVECVMWPDDFLRFKDEFQEDRICFVKGAVERTRDEPGLVLTQILSIEQAKRELTRGLALEVDTAEHSLGTIDAVGAVLRRTPGRCPVYLSIRDAGGKRTVLKTGNDFAINPASLVLGELEALLGAGRVSFTGANNGRNGR